MNCTITSPVNGQRLARHRPRSARRIADRFTGNDACDLSQLRADLDRFAFLLGGSGGDSLFHPGQH